VTAGGFVPATLSIKKGDTVKWVWEAGAGSHELLDGDPEDMDNAGKLFDIPLSDTTPDHNMTFTFQELGTVTYFSRTNPGLYLGTITVTAATPVRPQTWGWLKSVFQGA
jgi:plastocyanin